VFDTNLVVVGNVLTAPEWRRIASTGSLVANFKIASTARRYDRDNNRWIDGNNFRVRVTAWRRLAEGVASSVTVGDPIVVFGRLYCRDWKDEKNNNRVSYEMEAHAIGHDLAKGRAKFFRVKGGQGVSELDAGDPETFVRGERSVPVTGDEAPVVYGDGLPDRLAAEESPSFLDVVAGLDDLRSLPSGGKPVTTVEEAVVAAVAERAESDTEEPDEKPEVEPGEEEQPAATRRVRRVKRERESVPA
jgi:single-strand DNA-binding protein